MRDLRAVAICSSALIIAGLISNLGVVGQESAPPPVPPRDRQIAASPQSNDEYAALLARVQQGDMTVDFRAFRIAGAAASGPRASAIETGERAAFRNLFASGNHEAALDSAQRALNRNYASPIAHFDAMSAYQALGKTEEAAAHERILNALLDSIRKSGDGKSPETAYFVVTVQEEYIFLNRVLHDRATSQAWVREDGHLYDRLHMFDGATNEAQDVWFNADFDSDAPDAVGEEKDAVLATTTVIRSGAASEPPPPSPHSGVPQTTDGDSYGVGPGVTAPVVIFKREPEYSKEARKAKFQGTVVMVIRIDAEGNVANVRVIKPLGLGLDEKAVEAVKTWKFKPAMRNGVAVPVAVSVQVSFKLM